MGLSILLGDMVASRHPSWRHNMFVPFSLRDRQSSMRRLEDLTGLTDPTKNLKNVEMNGSPHFGVVEAE
jgi:hypothetical protein